MIDVLGRRNADGVHRKRSLSFRPDDGLLVAAT